MSVPQSLILLMTRYGMNVRLTRPPEFKLMPEVMEQAADNARKSHGSFEIVEDFDEGMAGADVVYAKSWGAHMLGVSDEEGAEIAAKYTDWISDVLPAAYGPVTRILKVWVVTGGPRRAVGRGLGRSRAGAPGRPTTR